MANKLELTWVGKEERIEVEPRILIEVPDKSFSEFTDDLLTAATFDNMLIHGDNLLALKALESKFAGMVKCIYIDPPYNTGNAFEYYEDNLEHSIWLNLMRPRLEILRNLLSEDGTIWIQIDDEEQAYLKVLCDEVFGRRNFINMISVNMKNIAGASGGGEDKRLKKNCEYVLTYAKDYEKIVPFAAAYNYTPMYDVYMEFQKTKKNWHYNSVLYYPGEKVYCCSTQTGNGDEIKIYRRVNAEVKSLAQISKLENISIQEVFEKYSTLIFEAKDAQSSIRTRVIQAKRDNFITDDIVSIEYVPTSGRNKGTVYEQFYKGDNCRLFAWLGDISEKIDDTLYRKTKVGTYWDYTSNINNLTKEGTVVFPMGKKPEALIQRIFDMCTNPGDLVLDSFLGSGTTAAVAHKMGRRWIGIEMGDHAYTHCKVRLDKVIKGEDAGGITKAVKWTKGGGYKFYELAPTLIKLDAFGEPVINKEYDADRLAAAVALHEGFNYQPDAECFWKQSVGNEQSYLFVTTTHISAQHLDAIKNTMQDGEFLIIACKSFDQGIEKAYKEITIKKIPQMLLDRCKFGVADYNLNIINPPVYEDEEECND